MNILMISKSGDGLGIAQKLAEEGHSVKVYIREKGYELAGVGIVDRVTSWRPMAANWADFVVADMVGFGHLAKTLDKFDVPHLGFNQIADLLELDRQRQMQVFRRVGIPIPPTVEYDSPGAARDQLDNFGPGQVIKASGNLDTGKTFVCRRKEEYEWALEQFAGHQELIVQEFVEGVEVSTEGWFNGEEWIEPFNHTFEEKRFLEGNLGPNTGCMGNVVLPVKRPGRNRLVAELQKLSPFLKAASYRGPVDLNMIVGERGPMALELTPRFGYDAIEALHQNIPGNFGQILLSLAKGELKKLELLSGVMIAVRLSVPPYPGKPKRDDAGLPVMGLPKNLGPYYLTDIHKDKGMWKWSAADGVLMKVVASGRNVAAARKAVYKRIDPIDVLGLQYRLDIGERVDSDMTKLTRLGVI